MTNQTPVKADPNPADIAASVTLLVLTWGFDLCVLGLQFMGFAFADSCGMAVECDFESAINFGASFAFAAFVVTLVGSIVTITKLVWHRPGWPWALGAALLGGGLAVAGLLLQMDALVP